MCSFLKVGILEINSLCLKILSEIKEPLVVLLHFSVTLLMYASIVCSVLFVVVSTIPFEDYPFFTESLPYIPYFFSYWVSITQFIYFNLYTAIDLINIFARDSIRYSKIRSKLHTTANYLLFTIVFPLSIVVTIVFWGFYFWDRELLYPKLIDEFYPTWLNHVMHSLPVPLSIVYMAIANNDAPPKNHTIAGLALFLSVYAALFFRIRVKYGRWVYLLLHNLTSTQVKITLSFVIISSFVFLLLGHYVNENIRSIRMKLKKTV